MTAWLELGFLESFLERVAAEAIDAAPPPADALEAILMRGERLTAAGEPLP